MGTRSLGSGGGGGGGGTGITTIGDWPCSASMLYPHNRRAVNHTGRGQDRTGTPYCQAKERLWRAATVKLPLLETVNELDGSPVRQAASLAWGNSRHLRG